MKIYYVAEWVEADGTAEADGGVITYDYPPTVTCRTLRRAYREAEKLLPKTIKSLRQLSIKVEVQP